jgi:hypothetical protein
VWIALEGPLERRIGCFLLRAKMAGKAGDAEGLGESEDSEVSEHQP